MGIIISLYPEKTDPHFIIMAADGVHAVPISVFQRVIDGTMSLVEIEKWELLLPAIIKDWMRLKMGE
jgi:hypothetical protein